MAAAYPTIPGVTFKAVVGFPLYCVGDDGSVWTSVSAGGSKRKIVDSWRKLNPPPSKRDGYIGISLRRELGGKKYTRKVHRLVLEAFVGPRPPGMEGCHFPDPDKSNNRLTNLRWGTHSENAQDSLRQGKFWVGSKSNLAKLTESDIPVIRRMWRDGSTIAVICRRFAVTRSTIAHIVYRRTWAHVA